MDNQHRKIKGYRELSEEEIALMNKIKQKGQELAELVEEVKLTAANKQQDLTSQIEDHQTGMRTLTEEELEFVGSARETLMAAEPLRWAAMAKTDLQVGLMKLTRAVATPGFF